MTDMIWEARPYGCGHDLFAIFGALLLTGLGTAFGPIVAEHAPWHVKIGFGISFSLAIAVYVIGYFDMKKSEESEEKD